MDNNFSVYIHHNLINHKVYVGITSMNPPRLRWQAGQGYKENEHFTAAIEKYGWKNFEHIIVARNISKESAGEIEKDLIAFYNSTDREHGYNKHPGGTASGYKDGRCSDMVAYNKEYNKKYREERHEEILLKDKLKRESKTPEQKAHDAELKHACYVRKMESMSEEEREAFRQEANRRAKDLRDKNKDEANRKQRERRAKRKAEETPEQREARLAKDRAKAKEKRDKETPEERKFRLEKHKQSNDAYRKKLKEEKENGRSNG